MLSLEDLFTPITQEQALQSLLDVAEAVGLPTTAWESGTVVREILVIIASVIATFTVITTAMARGGLLDYATGDWLTLLARSVYGAERILPTFATGAMGMTNASLVTYSISAGDLHFLNSTTGKTYTNTTGGSLLASGGTLLVTVEADESGTASNATSGAVDALVTPLLGVTVTNPDPISGTDLESDEHLRQACRDKLAAASPNGPSDAYNYFARTATRPADGSNVGVTRSKVVQANGSVTVYVASATGVVAGTAGNPATDLGAVNLSIQEHCVPTGMTATTVSATPLDVLVTGSIYLKHGSNMTTLAARTAALGKLQEYFTTIPIGGFDLGAGGLVFNDAIIGQLFQAAPADFIQVIITLPAADTAVANNEVAINTSVLTDFTIFTT